LIHWLRRRRRGSKGVHVPGNAWVHGSRDAGFDLSKVAVWAELGAACFGSCQDGKGHNHAAGAQVEAANLTLKTSTWTCSDDLVIQYHIEANSVFGLLKISTFEVRKMAVLQQNNSQGFPHNELAFEDDLHTDPYDD